MRVSGRLAVRYAGRMRCPLLLVSLSLLSCGGEQSTAPPSAPAPVAPAPVSSPSPAPPTASQPAASAQTCAGEVCTPPATCLSYSGMQPGIVNHGCWITCAGDGSCPKGMACTMIYDGPGQVCTKSAGH
jgi:hypothetical protein